MLIYFQSVDIPKYTILTCASAVGTVLVISFLLIPGTAVSIWIALSIASVTAGVVGFAVKWDITLNLVSMIGILLSTGFSVDFTAHISYAYSVSRAKAPEQRAKEALHR
jgi:predicted RND superfamily exporter protein